MKKYIIFLLILNITHIIAGGEGGSSGGPRLNDTAILSLRLIDQIDNIELNDQINYPKSTQEKIKLLKKKNVQSIQLNDGTIFLNE